MPCRSLYRTVILPPDAELGFAVVGAGVGSTVVDVVSNAVRQIWKCMNNYNHIFAHKDFFCY